MNSTCIFCKIIQKSIPSKIIQENEHVLVIQDITPKAPIHYLILTKKHIIDLAQTSDQDKEYLLQMMLMIRTLALGLPEKNRNFNVVSNNGKAAGQSVYHLHMHFLAGRNIYEGGLSL